eukprot:1589149-Amphidinium_carterae.1
MRWNTFDFSRTPTLNTDMITLMTTVLLSREDQEGRDDRELSYNAASSILIYIIHQHQQQLRSLHDNHSDAKSLMESIVLRNAATWTLLTYLILTSTLMRLMRATECFLPSLAYNTTSDV